MADAKRTLVGSGKKHKRGSRFLGRLLVQSNGGPSEVMALRTLSPFLTVQANFSHPEFC